MLQSPALTLRRRSFCLPRRSQKSHPLAFLDLFSGVNAPLTAAMRSLGLDTFEPFDQDADSRFNILHNSMFALPLKLVNSGLVGFNLEHTALQRDLQTQVATAWPKSTARARTHGWCSRPDGRRATQST